MIEMIEKKYSVSSASDMEKLAEKIGNKLHGGECIELVADLGGGKTTFVRGLARGAGCKDNVSSPTFTVGKQYKCSRFTIYHYDFYRLSEPGVIAEELREALEDNRSVIVVEWGDTVQKILPSERILVEIRGVANNENERIVSIKLNDFCGYILGAIA